MDFFDASWMDHNPRLNDDLVGNRGFGTSDNEELIPQPIGSPSVPWRVVGPSPQQWGEIKDVFTQLYLVENRKLKDVRTILSKKHGFSASEKMYKRRIAEWKIRKNYKAKDKEVIAARVKACMAAGRDINSISYHGRPLKLDRVKRQYRTDKRFAQLWDHVSQTPDGISLGDNGVTEASPSTVSRPTPPTPTPDKLDMQSTPETTTTSGLLTRNMKPPKGLYNIEYALFHTREAVNWNFTAFIPLRSRELQSRFPNSISEGVQAGQTDQASAFWLALYHGYNYLEAGKSKNAWQTLEDCCKMVQPLILSAPLHLLSCLLLHFATSWPGVSALEQQLVGFVAAMTSQVLGAAHPLSKAVGIIATADVRDQVVESIMNLVIDGYSSHRKPNSSSLFALRVDQIDMLRKRERFHQAHSLCEHLIKDSLSMRRKRHRTALAALGRLYVDQNQDFAVEGVAHRILDHEASDTTNSNSGTTVWACDQLASLCLRRQEYVVAESYLRRAAWISYQQRYTHRGPSTRSFLEKLDSCVRQQGRQVSIDRLCRDMGIQMELVEG